MATSLFGHKTLCIITGASKGYGRSILEQFVTLFPSGSCFFILSRSIEEMVKIKTSLEGKHSTVQIYPFKFDQGNLSECSLKNIQRMFYELNISLNSFDQVVIVHNAGSLGDVTRFVTEIFDGKMVEQTMNVNISGTILLNTSLLSITKQIQNKLVINISSLAALQPFPSWSLYCTGKAARNIFFRTLAIEDKSIRVLNWAPGPLDTEMQAICRTSADDTIRKTFEDMHAEGKLLPCEESVSKLVSVMKENSFESGAHIDYYDECQQAGFGGNGLNSLPHCKILDWSTL